MKLYIFEQAGTNDYKDIIPTLQKYKNQIANNYYKNKIL